MQIWANLKCVDAVILFAVFTCIVNDAEQEKLIVEIHRVLKSDGILYINDFLLNIDDMICLFIWQHILHDGKIVDESADKF